MCVTAGRESNWFSYKVSPQNTMCTVYTLWRAAYAARDARNTKARKWGRQQQQQNTLQFSA